MNAMLPEDLEGSTIAGMQIGETAYTTPWAMWVDTDRRCWLNPNYPADDRPHGTVQMRIARETGGFRVWMTPGHRYSPQKECGHVGATGDFLPVVRLER